MHSGSIHHEHHLLIKSAGKAIITNNGTTTYNHLTDNGLRSNNSEGVLVSTNLT